VKNNTSFLITQILKELRRELLYLDIGLEVNTNGHKLLNCSLPLQYWSFIQECAALLAQRSAAASF